MEAVEIEDYSFNSPSLVNIKGRGTYSLFCPENIVFWIGQSSPTLPEESLKEF
jgi:hypothetical protein